MRMREEMRQQREFMEACNAHNQAMYQVSTHNPNSKLLYFNTTSSVVTHMCLTVNAATGHYIKIFHRHHNGANLQTHQFHHHSSPPLRHIYLHLEIGYV